MGRPGEDVHDLLLARYLRARRRLGVTEVPKEWRPDVRTCPHCGERAAFSHDERGGWAVCIACGRAA